MENLKMHTPDLAEENYRKLAELFPNAVTETITGYDEDGKAIIERAIDADVLRQEIAAQVVEGSQERGNCCSGSRGKPGTVPVHLAG